MSTKMYCYIVSKESFWNAVGKIRKWSDTNLRELLLHFPDYERFNEVSQSLEKAFGLRLQVFEVDEYPNSYVFRALEPGYAFMNRDTEICPELERAFYDDRADVPEEDMKYLPLVDSIDNLIRARKYMIVPIQDEESMSELFFIIWQEKRKDAANIS